MTKTGRPHIVPLVRQAVVILRRPARQRTSITPGVEAEIVRRAMEEEPP